MSRYSKKNPRLNVAFYDDETDELLFEINHFTALEIEKALADHYVTELVNKAFEGKKLPQRIGVYVSGIYELN